MTQTKTYMNEAAAEHLIERIRPLAPAYSYAVVPSAAVGKAFVVRVGHAFWQTEDGAPDYLFFHTVEAVEAWAKEALGLRSSDPLPAVR